MTFPVGRLAFIRETLKRGAQEQAENAPARASLVDGRGTGLAPAPAELERLEPFGSGFPEPLLVVTGVAGPAKSFGQGHRKFRLQGQAEEFTLFASGSAEPLEGPLNLAIAPLDHPRWGRSWRVDGFLTAEETR